MQQHQAFMKFLLGILCQLGNIPLFLPLREAGDLKTGNSAEIPFFNLYLYLQLARAADKWAKLVGSFF